LKDKLGIGMQINSQKLYGDSYEGTFEYGINPIYLRLNLKPSLFIDAEAGYSKAKVANPLGILESDMFNGGLKFGYRMFDQARVTPLLYAGLGALSYESPAAGRVYDGYGALGGGLEFFVNHFLGVNLTADYRMTTSDDLDGADLASPKDSFLNVSFGLNYYMGRDRTYYAHRDVDYNMIGEHSAVEQVGEIKDENASGKSIGSADYAQYALQREQLMQSITQSENEIKLLKAKVNVMKEHEDELEERINMAGLMGDAQAGKSRDKYLIHYRNAIILYQAKYFENAIITLQALIEEEPFHPLTANAWYWIGESRFNMENYQDAAVAFKRASLMSKSSLKSEISQLMIGLCLMKSGDEAAARINFEQLIQMSSNASCSELAREYLEDLTTLN
jgi:TolA-binding protein